MLGIKWLPTWQIHKNFYRVFPGVLPWYVCRLRSVKPVGLQLSVLCLCSADTCEHHTWAAAALGSQHDSPWTALQALVCLGYLPAPTQGAGCQAEVSAPPLPVQHMLQNPLGKEAPQPLNDLYVICLSWVNQNPAAGNRKEFGGMSSVQCNLNHILILHSTFHILQRLPELRRGLLEMPHRFQLYLWAASSKAATAPWSDCSTKPWLTSASLGCRYLFSSDSFCYPCV